LTEQHLITAPMAALSFPLGLKYSWRIR